MMKLAIQFKKTGVPASVVELVEIESGQIAKDEVLIDILLAAINPSHLLTLSGNYGIQPNLPAVPGTEGLGKIVETGSAVTAFQTGDLVMIPPYTGTWRQQLIVKASHIRVKFPSEKNLSEDQIQQLAMLMANPPTAWLLIKSVIKLRSGEWIIQNAANSAVGQYVMQLANIYGHKSINVMRRDGLEDLVARAKGNICLTDGNDLASQVSEATGGGIIRLAIDAVAGDATQRLANCLVDGGIVLNYGLLSSEPCNLSPNDIIFRDIRLQGIWLTKWLRDKSKFNEQKSVYDELIEFVLSGRLRAEIDATYPLENVKEAVSHAAEEGRNGKILLLPNGNIACHALIDVDDPV